MPTEKCLSSMLIIITCVDRGFIEKMKRILLLVLFLLAGCNYPASTLAPVPPQDGSHAPPTSLTPTNTPEITPTYEGCYFVWASHNLPELSKKVNDRLQTTDTSVTGNAYAYGEDCVYADGHHTFSALETDFHVQVKVKDLKDKKTLGDWIFSVMQVIEQLPRDEIPGGQPGRVEFEFHKTDSEKLFLNVSIDKYQREARELRGAELYEFFYKVP